MLQYPTLLNKRIINSDYLNDKIYNLLDETFQFPNSSYNFTILRVDKEYVARPDLISLDAYGDTMFADMICKVNGISNPFELNEGMNIVIPTQEYVLDFIKTPSTEDDFDFKSSLPTAKNKQEKRKPNEAIIGDTRFKIDKGSKIIIY